MPKITISSGNQIRKTDYELIVLPLRYSLSIVGLPC